VNRSRPLSLLLLSLFCIVLSPPRALAAEDAQDTSRWPLKLEGAKGAIIVYQPQLESYRGNQLEARAAVQVIPKQERSSVFGAVWFHCRLDTDLDTRMATLKEVEVTAAKFPDVPQEKVDQLSRYLERELPRWELQLSIDRLIAAMEAIEERNQTTDQVKTDPPVIHVATSPTVLILIDGDPILADLEDTGLKRVVNTPYFILQDPSSGDYFLKGGSHWYRSSEIRQGWKVTVDLPRKVETVAKQLEEEEKKQQQEEARAEAGQSASQPEAAEGAAGGKAADKTSGGEAAGEPSGEETPPAILVSLVPAELIQIDGELSYAPIEGTQLLYLQNSESDVLMDIDEQQYYILLAGRWYKSPSLEKGPWKYVPNDRLPADFSSIPQDSDMADVLANVPGTVEAKEAVLENSIPQTAEVDRKTAELIVEYDGEPKFEDIGETGMKYAVNTGKSVLLIDGRYYCCDNAIWFVAESPDGPWVVCDAVPAEVQDIPADSPVYNVKYVYIYDSTPEVVYIGYTPGYTGSYVYGGCVVYGTGYHYHPWYHHYYYPRPVTWGFGVHYNPYTGWGFAFGVSYGWLHVGVRFGGYPHYGGWWGPAGYRYGYRHGYGHGYRHGYYRGYARGHYNGARAGQVAGRPVRYARTSNNLYRNNPHRAVRPAGAPSKRRPAGKNPPRTRPAGGGASASPRTRPATGGVPSAGGRPSSARQPKPASKKNNVYTDRNGNVYRNDGNQWQKYDRGKWSNDRSPSRSNRGTPSNRSRQQLDRERSARQRGDARTRNHQSMQRSQPRPRTAAPRRSGGRRR